MDRHQLLENLTAVADVYVQALRASKRVLQKSRGKHGSGNDRWIRVKWLLRRENRDAAEGHWPDEISDTVEVPSDSLEGGVGVRPRPEEHPGLNVAERPSNRQGAGDMPGEVTRA